MVQGIGRRLIGVALALGLLAGGVMVWNSLSGPRPSLQGLYKNLDVAVQDLKLVQGGQGQRTWELTAGQSRYVRSQGRIEFDHPRITFYKDRQKNTIQANAPSGLYLQDEGRAELWPKVRATYGLTRVRAKRMVFTQDTQRILFKGNVHIKHPQLNATSDRAVYDLQADRMVLTGNVEVDVNGNATDRPE